MDIDSIAEITRQTDDTLKKANAELASIVNVSEATVRTAANTLEPLNRIAILILGMRGIVGLLSSVHPDAKIRSAADRSMQRLADFFPKLYLRKDIYEAVKSVSPADLDATARRFREKEMRDFELTGVKKSAKVQKEIRALVAKGVKLGQAFDRNIKDDVRSISLYPDDLAGLPEDYKKEHAPDAKGRVHISTNYPDYVPFVKYATSNDARRKLYFLYMNRGWPKNDTVFKELLAVRARHAHLLDYKNWADYVTADKMVGSGNVAEAFLSRVARLTAKRAQKDYGMLLAQKKKDVPGASFVAGWETAYYDNRAAAETAGVDSREVRNYFRFDRVKQGVFDTTKKLFGFSYKRVDVPSWHASVEAYDVYRGKACIGRFYLDLHPRPGKYNHAACFDICPGIRGLQLPEAALVCNFSKEVMDHSEVTTFFHEFGHLIHHLAAGNQVWARFSGIATEWDFVEAPSQMLEEWAWDYPTLRRFAKHVKTGKIINRETVARMRKSEDFGKGMWQRRQVFLSFLSLRYHMEKIKSSGDLVKILKREQKKTSPFPYVPGTHLYANFGHLNGYSAVYYTYLWSHAIGFDLFYEFKKKGMYDPATARRYRDQILAPGGSKDAKDLIHAFLGRTWNLKEFQRWLNT
jgi:thimet oligopeptidase